MDELSRDIIRVNITQLERGYLDNDIEKIQRSVSAIQIAINTAKDRRVDTSDNPRKGKV